MVDETRNVHIDSLREEEQIKNVNPFFGQQFIENDLGVVIYNTGENRFLPPILNSSLLYVCGWVKRVIEL